MAPSGTVSRNDGRPRSRAQSHNRRGGRARHGKSIYSRRGLTAVSAEQLFEVLRPVIPWGGEVVLPFDPVRCPRSEDHHVERVGRGEHIPCSDQNRPGFCQPLRPALPPPRESRRAIFHPRPRFTCSPGSTRARLPPQSSSLSPTPTRAPVYPCHPQRKKAARLFTGGPRFSLRSNGSPFRR
jgi:hypothetical protein